jgi:hypothetical protein
MNFKLPNIIFDSKSQLYNMGHVSRYAFIIVYRHLYGEITEVIVNGVRNQLIISYELPLVPISSLERLSITESILEELV